MRQPGHLADGVAAARDRHGRHDAARRVSLPARARLARRRGVRRRRGERAAPPPLRGLERVPRPVRRARAAAQRALARRLSSSRSSSCRTIRGSSAASSIPSCSRGRRARIRCSPASSRRRRARSGARATAAGAGARRGAPTDVTVRVSGATRSSSSPGPACSRTTRSTCASASISRASPSACPGGIVFKASFDKANRSNAGAHRGPGLDEGLAALDRVRAATGLPCSPTCTCPSSARRPREVVDVLQIPAFLCRQTDLLVAAGATGKPVNVKKGQWMHPEGDARRGRQGARRASPTRGTPATAEVAVTERGTFFGYGDLVVDMRALRAHARGVRRARRSSTPRTACSSPGRARAARAAARASSSRRSRCAAVRGRRRRPVPRDASRSRPRAERRPEHAAARRSSTTLVQRAVDVWHRAPRMIDAVARALASASSASTSTACSPTAASTSATSDGAPVELKRYDIQDGLGIHFLQRAGHPRRDRHRPRVGERAAARRELGIDDVAQDPRRAEAPGVPARCSTGTASRRPRRAFVGDDFPDLAVLRRRRAAGGRRQRGARGPRRRARCS